MKTKAQIIQLILGIKHELEDILNRDDLNKDDRSYYGNQYHLILDIWETINE